MSVVTVLLSLWLATVSVGWAEGEERRVVNFTFDQVDVRTFVKLVGEITGGRFVVGDDIEGKITVVSPRVAPDEVYPLFVSILESVGCTVLKEEHVHRVVKLAANPTRFGVVVGPDDTLPGDGIVTRVIRLSHVSVAAVQKVLAASAGKKDTGAIGAIEETNHLVVTDTSRNIQRIEKIVREIDQPGLAQTTEVVSLLYAGAERVAEQINRALAEDETRADQLRRRLTKGSSSSSASSGGAVAVAAPHSNSLILVGSPSRILSLKSLIAKMDVDTPSGRGRLNAIFLNYMSSEEAAKSITALLAQSAEKKASSEERKISIEAIPSSNALIVDAGHGDFEIVRRLVSQLDEPPQQVHIAVLIAEVSESDGFQFGVEMAALDQPDSSGDTILQGGFTTKDDSSTLMDAVQSGVFPNGISLGLASLVGEDADGNSILGFPGYINIDALKKKGNFRVKSETSLQAQNNKEATVSVVNEIPILKSTVEDGSGTAKDIIQNIERVDVGIKLKITPHVIPSDEIRLELNPSIEAVIDDGPDGTQFAPTIAKREVSTTVTVEDGKTVVIAGLTREDEQEISSRVPLLGSIPLLGWIFRRESSVIERTDILIFVTPRLVGARNSDDDVKRDWEKRTGLTYEEQRKPRATP